jgi:hypothetical protein
MLDLKGFFDETGHPRDPKAKVFGMSGCFASEHRWEAVERQWIKALELAGIDAFHASDCETGGGIFLEWPKPKRLALYKSFSQLVARHKLTHISCVIDLLAYRRLAEGFDATTESPYTLAFTACMIATAREAEKALLPKDEKVTCIVELQKEYRHPAEGAYYALVHLTPLGQRLMPTPVFAPKEAFVLFQAADLVSYEFGKFHLNRVHDPARPVRKSFVKMMGKTRAASHYYDEVHLCKMIESLKKWNMQQGSAAGSPSR